ncbi:rod-binding protein [Sphingomonas ginsenosidivorax]|uniref:Rod-binding protein n=1 Tax=Sphingomonas ginsenosidivorax TaxID=862135 RepID=A0A5C6UI29_9SPHN|nr:rod-binding protein [Sphingomonas ginsenosidivorax]TXC72462.1 rod-binding protein [Sphingomonas ginsenosidivorax]
MSGVIGATGGISVDTSRLKSSENLKKAGEKFEAVFDGLMLKSMRQAKLANPLFDSKAIDTFTEMQDAQVAQSMAEHAPMGIGKAMTEFLAKSQSDLNSVPPEPIK